MSSYADVAHAWAHNLDKAHNAANMRHNDGCIYSYSTCIGQRIELNGKLIFILDSTSYSKSTCGHQGWAQSAIPNDIDREIFHFKGHERGAYRIISGYTKEQFINEQINFGMKYLMEEYVNCQNAAECNTLIHGFSYHGFNEMVRWFNVTGCMTVKKLLRMKFVSFEKLVPCMRSINFRYRNIDNKKVRKFIQMMLDDESLEDIVDMVNGKGTWEAYQQRIAPLKTAEKTRRLRSMVFVQGPGWRGSMAMPTIHGTLSPVVSENPVNKKSIAKHQKQGDYIHWLYGLRKENITSAYITNEAQVRMEARRKAKKRLERHLGMNGWLPSDSYSPWRNGQPTSHNFNGITFQFRSWHKLKELSGQEYQTFCELPIEQQRQWIITKSQQLLEEFQEETRQHEESEARWAQHWKEQEELRKREAELEASKKDYIDELKQTPEGVRQLWHEGFKLYNSSMAGVFAGGNVLLRVRNSIVETSKGIKITIDECKRLWSLVKRWHENATSFSREVCNAIGNRWQISSYQNDILTAGCHSIAYSEMEYIANQLQLTA